MERDFDLIRKLLLHIERLSPRHGTNADYLISYLGLIDDKAIVVEHLRLLHEAGLIEGKLINHYDGYVDNVEVYRITWPGHDFIGAIRDPSLWDKAKESILKPTASITYGLLMEWLKQEARTLIGIL